MQVKNWSDFQHYKDRKPPWIKLHHELLDNYEFHCLQDASRALLPMLWLIASESEKGEIPDSLVEIGFRLRKSPLEIRDALNPLIEKGFIKSERDASTMLAACKQDARLDREEAEAEAEKETETEKKKALRAVVNFPEWLPKEAWNHYEEMRRRIRKPMTDQARIWAIGKLDQLRAQGHDPAAVLEQSVFNSWQGLFELKTDGRANPAALGRQEYDTSGNKAVVEAIKQGKHW